MNVCHQKQNKFFGNTQTMNDLYPTQITNTIKKLSWSLYDFIRSASEETEEFPTIEECRMAVEETFMDNIAIAFNEGELNTNEDIDALIFSIFNSNENYNLILKFSAKATIIHSKNVFASMINKTE